MKKIIILLGIILTIISCEKNKGVPELVEVSTGEAFKIQFEANWSANFHWKWINRESINVVDTTDLEYILNDPGMDGSPGTEVWTFVAKEKGDQIMKFVYQRPGIAGDEELITEEIRVIVD